ncbi:hypothetical protein [Undibacterium sp. RuTC16W]|uniref:hypothetical protein n=1 Tax=Undibacterium sp. RuTC16W TaxID=3413048 RepID=UPI003BF1250A
MNRITSASSSSRFSLVSALTSAKTLSSGSSNNNPSLAKPKYTSTTVTFPKVSYRIQRQVVAPDFMMRITVDSDCAAELRHLILNRCGKLVTYIRMQPVDHASRMIVWLCLAKPAIEIIIHTVMMALPSAEFGKITPLSPTLIR